MAADRGSSAGGESGPQGTLDAAIVELIANDKVKVPPYPHVALELDRLLGDEKSTIDDIANCAGTDQTIAAALLRTASSAAMSRSGSGGPLSLKTAVGRLGVRETRRIVFACAFGSLATTSGSLLHIRERIWREAAACAFLAQQLADLRKINKDEAFLCGLLHDFGRVISVATLEQLGVKVDPSLVDEGPDELEVGLDDLEDDIFGGGGSVHAVDTRPLSEPRSERAVFDIVDRFHIELGLVTATRWNLPPLLVEIIAGHHHPPSTSSRPDLIELMSACDDISMRLEEGIGITPDELEVLPSLRPGEAKTLATEIARLPQRLAPFLSASGSKERPFSRNPLASEREAWRPCKVPARVGDVKLEVCYVHARGFVVGSDVSLPEGNLMSFELEVDGLPLSVWGYPRVGLKEGSRWILDIKPFASSMEVLTALRGLLDATGS